MKKIALAVLFAFLFAGTAFASQKGNRVEVTASGPASKLAPGDEFWVTLNINIAKSWHIQSHWPIGEFAIPTVWNLKLPAGLTLVEMRYPRGEEMELFGEQARVYSKEIRIGAKLRSDKSLGVGKLSIPTDFTSQACNDQSCELSATVARNLDLEFFAKGEVNPADAQVAAELGKLDADTPQVKAESKPKGPEGSDKGLLLTLLSIFFSGLLLNLTPCVYPVIAVTIGFFSRQAGENAGQRRVLALLYGLGIAITFTALFVLASLAGVGFGAWLQNPIVLLIFGALIAAFALSYFGLFQLQPPMWLMAKIGGGKTGAIGSLLMGLTMGITAAPCVGPLILGLIIQVAKEGGLANGLLWGGSLSTGLALPYVLLGFFSGSAKALPKAGDWTEWMERMLGFLLLGVAIWFVNPLLPDGWLLPMMTILLAAAGLWLGFFEKSGRAGNKIWFARGAICVGALIAAFNLFGKIQAHGLEWQNYSVKALEQAKADGKPVLIDVTARWCLPCKIMEETTFKNSQVVAQASNFVRLRVDLTGEPDENVRDAIQRFGAEVQGSKRLDPPQLVFISTKGEEMTELHVNEKVDAEEMLEKLRRVK